MSTTLWVEGDNVFHAFTSDQALYVADSLRLQRLRLINSGVQPHPDALKLEYAAAEQGMRTSPPRVTKGHRGSDVGRSAEPVDAEHVTNDVQLTIEETALRMRCSKSTVKRRIRDGELVPARHGRVVRLAVADVDTYIANHLGA